MQGNVLLFLIKEKNQSSRISRGKGSACARVHSPMGWLCGAVLPPARVRPPRTTIISALGVGERMLQAKETFFFLTTFVTNPTRSSTSASPRGRLSPAGSTSRMETIPSTQNEQGDQSILKCPCN